MNKLTVKLENCYGIVKLEKEFDFNKSNVNAIYARNGLMKTSFLKTFKMIQMDKADAIKDEIFDVSGTAEIKVDGNNISKEQIFVIRSFESSYESDSIAPLLVNSNLKESIGNVLKLRDGFLKILEKRSGLKVSKTSLGKKVFELEPNIIKDFKFSENSFLLNIDNFNLASIENDFRDVQYASIFDDSVMKKIESNNFQRKISEFLQKSDEIYKDYDFLDKGNLTLPKLKDIVKGLQKNNYFVKNNKMLLAGVITVSQLVDMDKKIAEIEGRLKDTPELKDIEKLLSDAKGMILKDIIENNPTIVEHLAVDKLEQFRRQLWLSYIKTEVLKFEELKAQYHSLEKEINATEFDRTPWKEALDIFEKRFTVPYKMEISNLKSSIIGESVPKVVFSFCRDGNRDNFESSNWVKLDRDELDNKDTLSQGEKRALYLLNIIFDIEQRKRNNEKTLFIIDDIADSFDYKNKYAIVEYLYKMSENNDFYMIILSHNFDFYRTISSRLDLGRCNRLSANSSENQIVLDQEKYQNQPFDYWKNNLCVKNIIALIPFVRNMIEYGVDKKINDFAEIDSDFLFLTNLLHSKESTNELTFGMLKKVYKEYIGKDHFEEEIFDTIIISKTITKVADTIQITDVYLENKIVLSIAIRLKSEEFMKKELNKFDGILFWKYGKERKYGNKEEFMSHVNNTGSQTRELFNGYSQICKTDEIKVLERVNIMTPENIHLNSFMYEPILDMDIIELLNLYNEVKKL